MIGALVVLLGCQLAGEAVARAAGLPVPGAVIGFGLLLLALALRGWLRPDAVPAEATPLGVVAGVLLGNLSLLFVPAGTGVVQQGPVLLRYGPGLVFAAVARRLRVGR
jgi:putative effector of murein hydrolase LrgA (UPF0299 family)